MFVEDIKRWDWGQIVFLQMDQDKMTWRIVCRTFFARAGRLQKVNRLEPGDVTQMLVQYERDGFGQITKATYPDGLTGQFAYDSMRRLTNAVDRAGRETHLEYWPIGKIKSVKRQMGGEFPGISFDYDEQGTDLKITDELGRVVEGYALDVAGRPTVATNILGQTLQVTYAIFDLPQQIQRFDGSYVNFAYDVAWRLATITKSAQGQPLTIDIQFYKLLHVS